MVKAVYAGTFDPVTFGHLDIISRASEVFDHVVVATTEDTAKEPLLGIDKRLALLRGEAGELPGIEIRRFSGLLIDFARQMDAKVLIRGLRAVSDFEYEFKMAMMNRELDSEIETVFLVTRHENMFISSTLVREIARVGGDISPFVPKAAKDAIMYELGR